MTKVSLRVLENRRRPARGAGERGGGGDMNEAKMEKIGDGRRTTEDAW